jgi:cytoskeletal protein CcmA (bactofilin family)
MWSSKRPEASQAAKPEPRSLQTNQTLKSSPTTVEEATQENKEAAPPTGTIADSAASRLGPGLHVKGEISGDEDLLIDGLVEGSIRLEGSKLAIGARAKVTADIVAGEAVVSGYLKGNVCAKNRIEIKKNGSVTGDLTTAQIMIEDGAYFKGSIEIDRGTVKKPGENRPRTGGSSVSVRL